MNVFVLAAVFLKLCRRLSIKSIPIVDPALFINRCEDQTRNSSKKLYLHSYCVIKSIFLRHLADLRICCSLAIRHTKSVSQRFVLFTAWKRIGFTWVCWCFSLVCVGLVLCVCVCVCVCVWFRFILFYFCFVFASFIFCYIFSFSPFLKYCMFLKIINNAFNSTGDIPRACVAQLCLSQPVCMDFRVLRVTYVSDSFEKILFICLFCFVLFCCWCCCL